MYHGKCAYCETFTKAKIEHYRPKKGIDGLPDHNGYYWLCYEWSNLIPSCHDCNTSGGKGNKFPIQGDRVIAPLFELSRTLSKPDNLATGTMLISEQPLLLHPEIDNPGLFFSFAIDSQQKGIELQNVHVSHTLLRTWIVKTDGNFSRLVIPLLQPEQQPLVLAAFRKYRHGV